MENPGNFIANNFTAARTGVESSVRDAAAYAQRRRMLPLTGIVGGPIRLLLALLKPPALIYGAAKVWQKAQPLVAPRCTTDIQ